MADYGAQITLDAESPDPTYTGGPWDSGVLLCSSGDTPTGYAAGILLDVSPIGEYVDIATGGNYAALTSSTVALSVMYNGSNWLTSFDALSASLYGAQVVIGPLSGATLTPRATGYVTNVERDGAELRLSIEPTATRRHREIPKRILTTAEFSSIKAESEGLVLPAIYGAVERMTGPSVASERLYFAGYQVVEYVGQLAVDWKDVSATCLFSAAGSPTPTVAQITVIATIRQDAITGGIGPDSWVAAVGGFPLMAEVVGGTGAGQSRAINSIAALYADNVNGDRINSVNITFASNFDTLLDSTSQIRIYSLSTAASFVIGDEAVASEAYAVVSGQEYPIAFENGALAAGINTVDVSAEFAAGENYAAIRYHIPDDYRGLSEVVDGFSASNPATVSIAPYAAYGVKPGDIICYGRWELPKILDEAGSDSVQICIFYSFDVPVAIDRVARMAYATRWDGTVEWLELDVGVEARNNYPSSIVSDGEPGNYGRYPVNLDFPLAIEQYKSVTFGILARSLTTTPATLSDAKSTWTTGSDVITVLYPRAGPTPVIGGFIRPSLDSWALGEFDYSGWLGNPYNWQEIVNVTSTLAGGGYMSHAIQIDTTWKGPSGDYYTIYQDAANFVEVDQYQVGLGAIYGGISPDAQFAADLSSGRTYGAHWPSLPTGKANGDPITLPGHVALDLLYRDLGLGSGEVDQAPFEALPSGSARVALVAQEDSAAILARMAREWNWVIAHDVQGKEVATAWLERHGGIEYDYAIANADIVEGSLTGLGKTAILDIITEPSLSWDWTPLDGFRQSGQVLDITVDPATLNGSNYLQYISGMGDAVSSIAQYSILHNGYKTTQEARKARIEYRYGGLPEDLYMGALAEWLCQRKTLLDFRILDTHSASAAYCGQRIRVTHRRHTGGDPVYGTLVSKMWIPGDNQVQMVVMLDAASLTSDDNIFRDVYDGSAEVYTDQYDGTSELYLDGY